MQVAADTHEQPRADQVKQALTSKQHEYKNAKAGQRRQAPARQHPIVNLQHENRAGKREDVDHGREHADGDNRRSTGCTAVLRAPR